MAPTPQSPLSPLYVESSLPTPIPPSITSDSEVSSPQARPFPVAAETGSNDLSNHQTSPPLRGSLNLQKGPGPIITINQLLADYPLIKKQLAALKEQILEQESAYEDELSRMEIKYWNMSVQMGGKAPGPRSEDQNDDKSQVDERLEGLQCKLAQAEYEIQQLNKENQQLSALNHELQSEIEYLEEEVRAKDQADDKYVEEDQEEKHDNGYYFLAGESAVKKKHGKGLREVHKEDEIMLHVDSSWM